MTSSSDDIRVVVGIDFGTTYSGFAFAHKDNSKEIIAQDYWKRHEGWFKTPTVIKYDESYETVISWGISALAVKPRRKSFQVSTKPLALFKLYLLEGGKKPFLPDGLDYRKVIKDYLENLGKDVKKRIESHWRELDFYKNVTIVLTVPAEFDDDAISTLSECAISAGLIKKEYSKNLVFTPEPEAAAIHTMSSLMTEHHFETGGLFMVVDCGGGTVDLTVREIDEDELIEITERTGDSCGSSFIDQAYIEFLGDRLGNSVIDTLKRNHYSSLQYIVQEFCLNVKIPFTGQIEAFDTYYLDLDEYVPIKEYVMERRGEERMILEKLESDEWVIEVKYDDVKRMFDPVIEKILLLIKDQFDQLKRQGKKCSAMLLVGGFSESEYLQYRIKKEFSKEVSNISVPTKPITSVMKGAVKFGLSEKIIKTRKLKWTYGTCALRKWQETDPESKKLPNGCVKVFEVLAERDQSVSLDDKVTKQFKPYSLTQKKMKIDMYVTKSLDAKYIDDPEVKLLRKWEIDLFDEEKMKKVEEVESHADFEDVTISFILRFGPLKMRASAENKNTGEEFHVSFDYNSSGRAS